MSETQTATSNIYRVKLIGVLATAAGKQELDLLTSPQPTVSELVSALLKQVDNRQFRDFLVDSATNDPRPNVIIMLDEHDCNVLHGLRTKLEQGTVITIIPVAHGG